MGGQAKFSQSLALFQRVRRMADLFGIADLDDFDPD